MYVGGRFLTSWRFAVRGEASLTRLERVPDGVSLPFSGQFSRRKTSDFFRKTTSFDIVFAWFLGVVQLEGFTGPGDATLQAGYSPKIVAKSWSCGFIA